MSCATPQELKQTLSEKGFEVFRTVGSRVVLAERVRDNLIMDSGVTAICGEAVTLRVTFRSQATDFPGEDETQLFAHAAKLGEQIAPRGYVQVECMVLPIPDPGDPTKILDTWFEVAFEKRLGTTEQLQDELRYALSVPKST